MGKIILVFKTLVGLFFTVGTLIPAYGNDLLDVYRQAIQNDPVLNEAFARQLAVGESKDQSMAKFLPNISASAASSRNWLHNKKAGQDFRGLLVNQQFWDNTFGLNFTQPVFHWDHWVQLSRTDNQIAQAEADYRAEQQNLMVRITRAYFNVLSAEDTLAFANAEKTAIERQLEQAKQRFEVGLIAVTDVYEAQAGYDQARASEIEAQNNLDNQKEALREIIGEFSAELDALGEKLELIGPEPADISAWSDAAEQNNFAIVSAINQAEYSRKAIELQNSGHMPQLDIVGTYAVSDNNSTFGFRGDTQNIGLKLSVPLFEGGAVSSRVRQARHEYQAAREKLTGVQRSVTRQVKDSYRGVLSNISRVEALGATVKSAESALEATQAGFEVGTRTMVDVLAEQRNLYRAKRDYAGSRYDYLINTIQLKQAAGSLTENDLEYINSLLKH